jgi:AraC-like DNA-binding protein
LAALGAKVVRWQDRNFIQDDLAGRLYVPRMQLISQEAAVDRGALGGDDRVRFWRAPRHGGLEGLSARFRRHRYAPHTHETYAIGVILAGCETFRLRGERHYVPAGSLVFVNPGEVHDGEPSGDGYAYRMTYPSVALLSEVAAEFSGRASAAPFFPGAAVSDPPAYAAFLATYERLEHDVDRLAADEAMLRAYAFLIARHAKAPPSDASVPTAPAAVRRVREYLDAHAAEQIDLSTLSDVAGVTRYHLVRLFRREVGLTPHAYLTDRRIHAARKMLADGMPPAEVATACGFFDQSHLTRAFKSRAGVGPGAYRAG